MVATAEDLTFVERPVGDRIGRAVTRARLAREMFSIDRPFRLGRYQVRDRIGTGGMSIIYSAWDPELERTVAIKLVVAGEGMHERIVSEGKMLARLSHPNVVPVFDVGRHDGDVFLVMEWVRGRTLRGYGAVPRTIDELVRVYVEAARGLAAAHDAGIVHQDFKPDNAVLGDDGRVRILDFGLASCDVCDGSGGGTPRYMAPEQVAGSVTPAVDQYAWCVSLREAVIARDADGTAAEIPPWLDAILARGTATCPADRFASIADLVDELTTQRQRASAGA